MSVTNNDHSLNYPNFEYAQKEILNMGKVVRDSLISKKRLEKGHEIIEILSTDISRGLFNVITNRNKKGVPQRLLPPLRERFINFLRGTSNETHMVISEVVESIVNTPPLYGVPLETNNPKFNWTITALFVGAEDQNLEWMDTLKKEFGIIKFVPGIDKKAPPTVLIERDITVKEIDYDKINKLRNRIGTLVQKFIEI